MKYIFISILFIGSAIYSCDAKENTINKNPEEYINSFFPNEIKPEASAKCFQGAYYRKCVTSKDRWYGITGKVVLPKITFDPARINPAKPQQYLDNPSVYLGGQANGQETDIGMTWEVIRDKNGIVTPDRRAFRPFIRWTKYENQAAGYENAPAQDEYYWYQGDTITISLKLIESQKMIFTVEGMGKKFEKTIPCNGYQIGSYIEYKRVNAIDQVSNEGKPAQPTQTKVENSTWINTNLWRKYNGAEYLVPMHKERFTDMRCPDIKFFAIDTNEEFQKTGRETIAINGGK